MLDRLVVDHSDDVDRLSLEHSAVGRYSLPVDAGSDTIVLGDHIFDPHFESRHGAARDLHDVGKAARSANLAFTEPLVIDIVRRDELINPGNVTRPEGLHHPQHHRLRWHPRMMSHSPRLGRKPLITGGMLLQAIALAGTALAVRMYETHPAAARA
jgi:hypothetical protein